MALRIALFGQAPFGRDVLDRLVDQGHEIVGVYTPPESGRPDPLAEGARERGLRLIQHRFFRRRTGEGSFEPIPARLEEHASLGADLNLLAFVTAILPAEIVDGAPHRSLCFHPSLLPKYRGGAALAWQIMRGEQESGVTIFQPDAGVDTGPVVVQKSGVEIAPTDTAASLYFDKLYPLGVDACAEAVAAVADGSARYTPQDEAQASFQGLVGDAEARLDWGRPAAELDRQIRGCDPQPGAWAELAGEPARLYGARLLEGGSDEAPGTLLGLEDGRLVLAARGGRLSVAKLKVGGGKKLPAAEAGLEAGQKLS
jgi:methionyl-tRNA formyltransferase